MITPKHIVAACGFVTNIDGEVLMMEHPRRGWEFPGGQVEEGESLTDALVREIQEETGVAVDVEDLVGIYSNIQDPTKVIFSFLCTYISGKLTTSSESLQVQWMHREDVLDVVTHPSVRTRLEDMLDFVGEVNYCVYTMRPYTIYEKRKV